MVGRELRAEDHGSNFARALIAFFMNAALIVAPGFLGGLAVFFVLQSFGEGIGSGLRSFAAVVFPLMVLAFVKAGQVVSDKAGHTADDPAGGVVGDRRGTLARKLRDLPVVAEVAITAVVGAASMALLELSTTIPVVELVLATGFSFIVYVLSEGRDRAAPYCLGLVVGSLGYVIMVGVPNL